VPPGTSVQIIVECETQGVGNFDQMFHLKVEDPDGTVRWIRFDLEGVANERP